MIPRKILCLFILALSASFSGFASAIPFNQMAKWGADTIYCSGDVVASQYDIYVALFPSKGQNPTQSKLWRRVNLKKLTEFQVKKLYLPAAVVKIGDKYYLAKYLNVPLNLAFTQDNRLWLEFTHPGLSYGLPDPTATPDNSVLLGNDTNQNQIRDDYEVAVAYSNLPSEVIDSALVAGNAYTQLMSTGSTTSVDPTSARSLMEKLVRAEQCKRQMAQLYSGTTWKDSTFFNTIERVQAKHALQNMLASVMGDAHLPVFQGDACESLAHN